MVPLLTCARTVRVCKCGGCCGAVDDSDKGSEDKEGYFGFIGAGVIAMMHGDVGTFVWLVLLSPLLRAVGDYALALLNGVYKSLVACSCDALRKALTGGLQGHGVDPFPRDGPRKDIVREGPSEERLGPFRRSYFRGGPPAPLALHAATDVRRGLLRLL